MKKRVVKKRTWLNPTSTSCAAACFWNVQVDKAWNTNEFPNEYRVSGEFSVNDEGKSHYIDRKADMRPLYKLQEELRRFIDECELAILQVKEHNDSARSKKAAP
jgi:hypothetical protein